MEMEKEKAKAGAEETISHPNHHQQSPHPTTITIPKVDRKKSRHLIPLRTSLETRDSELTLEVWITRVQRRSASGCLGKILPNDGGLDLQHLRRFARANELPANVLSSFPTAFQTPDPIESSQPATEQQDLFMLLGSSNLLSKSTLIENLTPLLTTPILHTIPVSKLAPTSAAQAQTLTARYWPTIYKKSNPFGPHPSLVSRAAEEMTDVETWMDLAERVAREAKEEGRGEEVGCVIVEREEGVNVGRCVVAAGDARWAGNWKAEETSGNAAAHAVMRAIGMVATILKASAAGEDEEEDVDENKSKTDHPSPSLFHDTPLSPLETTHFSPLPTKASYLCHGLEIYITHEPCVMCSMAIIHSRFGRVVFGKRMRAGGLCAEVNTGGLGLGLWWRKELNWTVLAWEFGVVGDEDGDGDGDGEEVEVLDRRGRALEA